MWLKGSGGILSCREVNAESTIVPEKYSCEHEKPTLSQQIVRVKNK